MTKVTMVSPQTKRHVGKDILGGLQSRKAAIIRTVERLMQQYLWHALGTEAKNGCNAWSQEEQHQGKIHPLWKGLLFDRAHTRIIAIHLWTPQARNGSVSPHGGLRPAKLSNQFHEKSRDAQYHSAWRFISSQGLVFCLGTNESQWCLPGEVAAKALECMQNIARPKVSQEGGRHNDFIHNMDQTPIPFTYNARKTLELVGKRTVHICKSTGST